MEGCDLSPVRTPVFQGGLDEPGDPLFWAPLLGELAGLRCEEALQLRLADFHTDEGVAYLAIGARDAAQRVKSKAARRNVPLHHHLIELGLLDLVALRRSQNFRTLFPHQTRGATKGRLSENFSKRFTHYRKQHGVYEPQLDFHSFRSGFQQRLKHKLVAKDIRQELLGHERTDVIDLHYDPELTPVPLLKPLVDLIDLDVSMIRSPFPKSANASGVPTLRLVRPGPRS